MYCIQCGKELEKDAKFCTKCGAAVAERIKDEQIEALKKINDYKKKVPFGRKVAVAVIVLVIVLCIILPIISVFKKSDILTGNFEMRDVKGNVLITVNDIASATAEIGTDQLGNKFYAVELDFTERGKGKLEAVTSRMYETEDALFVFLDDECIWMGRISYIVTNGKIQIPISDSYKEANRIVERMYGIE